MGKETLKWIRAHYNKIVSSIAFYPAIIAILFLVLSWVMLEIDFSAWGKNLKSNSSWLSLKDASTARTIISTVAGGVISLTVFSFSMVMIVLNQAASQMSNRVLTSMIENRFQQIVLGFYIGTIVYAMFLLSTIRDINSGIYVPALSIYLLILLTVTDIFFFIYFLDYVTQTVKHETVIGRVQKQTRKSMEERFCETSNTTLEWEDPDVVKVYSPVSGYFQGFNTGQILKAARHHNVVISFLHENGTYIIKDSILLLVYGVKEIDDELKDHLFLAVDFYDGQPVEENPNYGFRHLTEVALKALSPGINDPATAVLCVNALTDLFSFRLHHYLPASIKDENDKPRILIKITSFTNLFEFCVFPIWHYGKKDPYIQNAILHMINQLKQVDSKETQSREFNKLINEVKREIENRTM